jgi:hypothetical protein
VTAYSSGDDDFDRWANIHNGYLNPDGTRGPAWDNPNWRQERAMADGQRIEGYIIKDAATIMAAAEAAGFGTDLGITYKGGEGKDVTDRYGVRLGLDGGEVHLEGDAKAMAGLFRRMAERKRRMKKAPPPEPGEHFPTISPVITKAERAGGRS